ncbi:MAG: tetratricopeptide repeat protein [Verrucomicrobiota bacterium]|jgi:tetratricopeptide (TPR) repeat protein
MMSLLRSLIGFGDLILQICRADGAEHEFAIGLVRKGEREFAEILLKTVEEKGVEAAVKQYRELRAAQPEAYDYSEEQLNYLGYHLIGMGRIKDAIGILKLNAEAYPQSSNVYDSLGEAYLDDGDKELAIENYEKSLQLDPKNRGAIEKLKQLKAH